MGGGSWKSEDWDNYSSSQQYATRTPQQVINTSHVVQDFLPINFKNGRRESRDSVDNPRSTPIIFGGDVTGSMGTLAGILIKDGMAKFATELYARKTVTDPHIMGMAIGDAFTDSYPIQATQFEADIRIIQQFEQLFIEGNGGGNGSEGYIIPWLVAALMTDIDSFEKRQEKGIIFTYGDDGPTPMVTRGQAKQFLGLTLEKDLSAEDILTMVTRKYDVYHFLVHRSDLDARISKGWGNLLGERAIPVQDHTKLAEIAIGILEVTRKGADKQAVAKSFSKGTDLVVAHAIKDLTVSTGSQKGGLVHL